MTLMFMQQFRNYVHPQNVYEALRPLVIVCSYMGLVPVVLIGERPNQHFQVTRVGYLNAVLHVLLYIASFSRSLRSPSLFSYFFNSDEITNISSLIQVVSSLTAMGVVYYACFAKRYCFVSAINVLHQIDRNLESLGVKLDFVATFRTICWGFLGTSLIFTVYIASSVLLVEFSNHVVGITTFVTYFMPHTVAAQIVFKNRMMLRQIRQRMTHLNEILAKLHKNTNLDHRRKHHRINKKLKSIEVISNTPDKPNDPKQEDGNPTKDSLHPDNDDTKSASSGSENTPDSPDSCHTNRTEEETIQKACDIHEELCDACYITEDYFSVVMLTIITIGFLIIVFNAYYVLEVTFRHNGKIDVETQSFIIFLVYQMFIHGVGLLVIVQNSSSVIEANEQCSIHVHKLMCRVKSEAARQKLLEFSLQLLNRNVRFTAYNLFPLDRTLIFTIIGAATTYLIILVQFSIQFR